jgi:hypothetical protein
MTQNKIVTTGTMAGRVSYQGLHSRHKATTERMQYVMITCIVSCGFMLLKAREQARLQGPGAFIGRCYKGPSS